MVTVPSSFDPYRRNHSADPNLSASSTQASSPRPRSTTRNEAYGNYPRGVERHLEYPNIAAWEILSRTAKKYPNRIAVEYDGTTFSYRQIDEAATRLANWLQYRGVLAGRRVAILLPNCPEYFIALNAVWKAGGVAVAISPLSVPADVRNLCEHTDCHTVVTLDLLSGLLPKELCEHTLFVSLRPYMKRWKQLFYSAAVWRRTGKFRVATSADDVWFWDAVDASGTELTPVETLPAMDPAYILSTGGTTADPKAVTLSHRNIVANAWQQMNWLHPYSTGKPETMLAVLPFFHSYGMSTMLATGPALGAKLIMQPKFDAKRVLDAIENQRPTVFHTVPAMLSALISRLRHDPRDLSSLRWVISGGASLPPTTAFEFENYSGARVVEGYGLSEASPVTHVGPLDGSNETGTIGLPLPDTECRIVNIDRIDQDVAHGEVGELLVKGPQVMLGYWKNEKATAAVMQDGWLRTGDLARRTPRGFYQVVDRKKDLIITSGFNVYPADVEEVLREFEDIQDAAVIGVPHRDRGEIVKACIVLRKGVRWDQSRLEKFCQRRLAKHRRPKLWEHVKDDLPRNFLGKVIRRELRDPTGQPRPDARS